MKKANVLILGIFCIFQSTHAMMQRALGIEAKKKIISRLQKSQLQKRFHNSCSQEYFSPSKPEALDVIVSVPIGMITGSLATYFFAEIDKGGSLIVGGLVGFGTATALGGVRGVMGLAAVVVALGIAINHDYEKRKSARGECWGSFRSWGKPREPQKEQL